MGDAKFVFEARTIQRMELLVLSTLRWRMQTVTPFSFIDYFLFKINGNETQLQTSILRSIELILSTIKGDTDGMWSYNFAYAYVETIITDNMRRLF